MQTNTTTVGGDCYIESLLHQPSAMAVHCSKCSQSARSEAFLLAGRCDRLKIPQILHFSFSLISAWVLAARERPCTARTRLFRLVNTQNWALRAPLPPIADSLILNPCSSLIKRENLAKNPVWEKYAKM